MQRDPPEVDADETWVHSGIGNQAILTCTVYAEPPAEVRWYRSDLKLDVTDDHKTEKRGSRYRLIIARVQLPDLDNYTCEAKNNFGSDRESIILTGKPHQAVFRSPPVSKWRDGYNISWSVFSYTAVDEHKLFHRQADYGGRFSTSILSKRWGENLTYYNVREWTDVSIAANNDYKRADITQEMSYMILGLEANTQYEAKVQTRNTFGWSKMSEIFKFSTSFEGGYSWEITDVYSHNGENEIRDLSVTAHGDGGNNLEPLSGLCLFGTTVFLVFQQ
ncbi:Immunoglobulin domain [Nesidiocoris tenuis]|uniref:Immunoglobulin domain n=1 Tax=Nesidiocoris tenuis TaxID=355587 RepID=A0ABN7AFK3_9HEMI|nr:Immunoglobulin domain [Nesidiocoris tenuis]